MCRQAKQVVYLGKDSNKHDGQGTELLKIRNTAAYEATCVAASRDDVLGRFVKRQSYDERKPCRKEITGTVRGTVQSPPFASASCALIICQHMLQ